MQCGSEQVKQKCVWEMFIMITMEGNSTHVDEQMMNKVHMYYNHRFCPHVVMSWLLTFFMSAIIMVTDLNKKRCISFFVLSSVDQ